MSLSSIQTPPSKPQRVFKVYQRNRQGKTFSCYHWRPVNLYAGKLIKSDRPSTSLEDYEKAEMQVHQGLHAFTNIDDARAERDQWDSEDNRHIVAELEGLPEDFVANGTFSGDDNVVYTKLRVIKVYRK